MFDPKAWPPFGLSWETWIAMLLLAIGLISWTANRFVSGLNHNLWLKNRIEVLRLNIEHGDSASREKATKELKSLLG